MPKGDVDFIPPPTACHHGVGAAPTILSAQDNANTEDAIQAVDGVAPILDAVEQQLVPEGINLFDNMDDVFGTFMDPNYPLNLDDMSFIDEISPFEWTTEINTGS